VKEIAMTRRVRLWTTAMLTIAATALMVSLAFAAQPDVNQTHTNDPHSTNSLNSLAGITASGID
jgi:hypothetical protein